VLQNLTGSLSRNTKYIFGFPSSGLFDGCLVIKTHRMPPSRPRGCIQENYQQIIPNMQFMYALSISCMNEVKNALAKVLTGFVH